MGGYNDLKTAITALIRTNDNQEITGATLQSALLSIINTIGQGSVFKGVATTSTNPGSPDADVFYIAGRPGYYPNFNLELTAGLHVIENKSGTWVNTEIALDVVDAVNIGGAKHVKPSQAMIVALQSVEQIPDSEGLANKMWWSTDGHLKYRHNDTVYDLGNPAYVLYYCGDQIYKWTGSGFREIGGGGTFASGEAVSSMSIFDDGSDTDGKSSAQLAAMIPSGEVIKSLLELISSIETSGGSYDGVDLITTFSYNAPTRVITVKQSGRQAKTIILPLANSTNAGLMSSEDKTQLANMQNLIGKTVNSFSKSTGETGITITLVTSNGTPYAVLIPIDSELSSQSTSNLVTGAAIYNFLMNGFVYLDQDQKAYAPYTRILPLVTMGSALDNGHTPTQIRNEEFYYEPNSKRIYRYNTVSAQPYFTPSRSQLYLNICTGKMYKWAGSDMEEISGGVDPATLAGKADKHTAADILTPSQWPRVMLYNIESMWGAGGTPPDYASIPVGSIYLDDSSGIDDPPYRRLFYKKTLEGTSQRIDLGAPQENTIYCHIATGKLYRWIPTQNGNDGTFQQVGGDLILPHIGQNGNWWVGPETDPNNDTGTKAQGPKGNSVVDGDTFDIVNNFIDGGEADALSAERGKWLYTTLYTIFSQLGTYAFPNGKPQIDWGGGNPPVIPPCTVNKTIGTGLSSTGGDSDVAFGDPLEVSIAITNNLYIVDDDSVVVTMGGSPVQGAWNASTMKVTIAAVTGNVVINVPSLTYVGYGEQNSPLVSMFDGKNVDSANNRWVDKMDNSRILQLSGCTVNSDHVEFDGSDDTAIAANTSIGVNVLSTEGTIEAVTKDFAPSSSVMAPSVFSNKNQINGSVYDRLICLGFWYSTQYFSNIGVFFTYSTQSSDSPNAGQPKPWVGNITSVATACVSVSNARGYLNGNALSRLSGNTGAALASSAYSKMGIASRVKSDGSETQKFAGKVYSVRIYSRQLTEQEALRNYAIDQKRFNIS